MRLARDMALAALLALVMGALESESHQREKAQARATVEAYEAIGARGTDGAWEAREAARCQK